MDSVKLSPGSTMLGCRYVRKYPGFEEECVRKNVNDYCYGLRGIDAVIVLYKIGLGGGMATKLDTCVCIQNRELRKRACGMLGKLINDLVFSFFLSTNATYRHVRKDCT